MESKQKAQQGLALIKEAMIEALKANPEGLTNSGMADFLDLRSNYLGGAKDYVTWSVLGLLINEKQVRRNGRRYVLVQD